MAEKKLEKLSINLEGLIGSGKTALLQLLGKNPEICAVPEPVWYWSCYKGVNALELLYKDPARYGYVFQNMVMASLITRKPLDERRVTIYERSVDSSLECFATQLKQNGDLMEIEYGLLKEFARLLRPQMTPVDAIIYLKVDPEVALERIKDRNRPEEREMKLEFLKELNDLHEKWMDRLVEQGQVVFTIDSHIPMEEMEKESLRIIKELSCYLSGSEDPIEEELAIDRTEKGYRVEDELSRHSSPERINSTGESHSNWIALRPFLAFPWRIIPCMTNMETKWKKAIEILEETGREVPTREKWLEARETLREVWEASAMDKVETGWHRMWEILEESGDITPSRDQWERAGKILDDLYDDLSSTE